MISPALIAFFVAAGYLIVGRASLLLAIPPGLASPVWPAAGLAVAVALRRGRPALVGVFLGSVLCNLPILLKQSDPAKAVVLSVLIAAGSTGQAWLAAFLTSRLDTPNHKLFASAENALAFTAFMGAATVVAACVGATAVHLADPASNAAANFLTWWLGDMLGIMLVAPGLLSSWRKFKPARLLPLAAATAASALAAASVFFLPHGGIVRVPWPAFVAMTVCSVLLGFGGASASAWALTATAITATKLGLGPFAGVDTPSLGLQGFLNACVLTGLTLASAVESLSARVRERTLQLEKAVAELRESNEDLEQFAFAASHDLKEPLRKISLSLDLLVQKDAARLDERSLTWIEHASGGARRLTKIVEDLLDLAQASRSSGGEIVDLDQAVLAVLDLLAPVIEEAKADVRVRHPLPKVPGRPAELRQLMQNLVSNALKFRSEGRAPVVTISAERRGRFWELTVRDNGIGIDPAYFQKIFVAFKRLHSADRYPGTGVGLALAKRIVERHGGGIAVSSNPGEGAAFIVDLPAEPAPRGPQS